MFFKSIYKLVIYVKFIKSLHQYCNFYAPCSF